MSPRTAPKEQKVDFTVNWQPPVLDVTDAKVTKQKDLNSLICNIQRSNDRNIPDVSDYKLEDMNPPAMVHTAWGISVTGTLIFNAISGE